MRHFIILAFLAVIAFASPVNPINTAFAGGKIGDHSLWEQLKEQLYSDMQLQDGSELLKMTSPMRALDAAIVPISLRFKAPDTIKNISLIIDHNPVPFAIAINTASPNTDPNIDIRIRIDSYTYLRAVFETKNGEFFETANFIKAAGGCSAPSLSGMAEAEKQAGKMKFKFIERTKDGKVKAQILIRHPNYSGFQFDQISRSEIPAYYIDSVLVTSNGQKLLDLEPSISISENPTFTFLYKDENIGDVIDVVATDNQGNIYKKSWPVPSKIASNENL